MTYRFTIELAKNDKYLVNSFSIGAPRDKGKIMDEKRAFDSLQEVFEFADTFFPSPPH